MVSWYRDEQEVLDSDRLKMEVETKGICHLTIKRLELADQVCIPPIFISNHLIENICYLVLPVNLNNSLLK